MTDIPFDDDDWMDLEPPPAAGVVKPDVTLSMTIRNGRYPPKAGARPRVRVTIWLRREAAQWIVANGPRFKAQIGGPKCNHIRVVADARGGRFEATEMKGVQRLCVGIVNVWPNEVRRDVEAKWTATPAGLVLTLPVDFATAGQGDEPELAAPVSAPVAAPAARPLPPPAAFPITTKAKGLERLAGETARAAPRRVLALPGEPAPGRSALDRRRSARAAGEEDDL